MLSSHQAQSRRGPLCAAQPATATLLALALLHATAVFAAGVVGNGTPASCTEAALDAALAGGGTVTFNCGPDPVTITLTSEKVITVPTTIDGGGLVTLSGGGAVRIFRVTDGALEVRSLTIAEGRGTGSAGTYGGSYGGGILNEGRDWNRQPETAPGVLSVINSTFSGNSAEAGGAIANFGTLSVTDSTFFGNGGHGGGAILNEGALTMTNSTLSRNQGLAISNVFGTTRLTNCTFRDNGGAIVNESCFSGDGMPCPPHGSVTLTNTIIMESLGPSCGGAWITDGGHNLQFPDTSCGGTIPSLDPKLDPAGLKDNGGPTQTIALQTGSPAITAGDPEVCADAPVNGVDQRGYMRPGWGHANCSIGAYEFSFPTPTPTATPIPTATSTPTPQPSGDGDGGGTVMPTTHSSAAWKLLVPAMALWWAQRRRRG